MPYLVSAAGSSLIPHELGFKVLGELALVLVMNIMFFPIAVFSEPYVPQLLQDQEKGRAAYLDMAKIVWRDRRIEPTAWLMLDLLRKQAGLSAREARDLMTQAARDQTPPLHEGPEKDAPPVDVHRGANGAEA